MIITIEPIQFLWSGLSKQYGNKTYKISEMNDHIIKTLNLFPKGTPLELVFIFFALTRVTGAKKIFTDKRIYNLWCGREGNDQSRSLNEPHVRLLIIGSCWWSSDPGSNFFLIKAISSPVDWLFMDCESHESLQITSTHINPHRLVERRLLCERNSEGINSDIKL